MAHQLPISLSDRENIYSLLSLRNIPPRVKRHHIEKLAEISTYGLEREKNYSSEKSARASQHICHTTGGIEKTREKNEQK